MAVTAMKNKMGAKTQVPRASRVPSTSTKLMNVTENEPKAKHMKRRKGMEAIMVKINRKTAIAG